MVTPNQLFLFLFIDDWFSTLMIGFHWHSTWLCMYRWFNSFYVFLKTAKTTIPPPKLNWMKLALFFPIYPFYIYFNLIFHLLWICIYFLSQFYFDFKNCSGFFFYKWNRIKKIYVNPVCCCFLMPTEGKWIQNQIKIKCSWITYTYNT